MAGVLVFATLFSVIRLPSVYAESITLQLSYGCGSSSAPCLYDYGTYSGYVGILGVTEGDSYNLYLLTSNGGYIAILANGVSNTSGRWIYWDLYYESTYLGPAFMIVTDTTTGVQSNRVTITVVGFASTTGTTSNAWSYFQYGNGINSNTKLPEGNIGQNEFTFWDYALAIEGTIAGRILAYTGDTEYGTRMDALVNFLGTMQLCSSNPILPYHDYYWSGSADTSKGCTDPADFGRLLNALGYLRNLGSFASHDYASTINSLLTTGNLAATMSWECTNNWDSSVYGRDARIGCTWFKDLNSNYDYTTWLNNFYSTWTGSNRISDNYGNSMPKMQGANLGPISYELLENGPDHNHTVLYASNMKSWAQNRYNSKGGGYYSLWGTEFDVQETCGNNTLAFAWEYYVTDRNTKGANYYTWQISDIDSHWFSESQVCLATSSLDAPYALRASFPSDVWLNNVWPRFSQTNLVNAQYGYATGVFEATNGIDPTVRIEGNAVVLMAALIYH